MLGADGLVGTSAVLSLSSMYGKTMNITAGVRNPAKAKRLASLTGVAVVKAELGNKMRLQRLFLHVDTVYIISSGNDVLNEAKRVIDTAVAAKLAGVKHIVMNSLVTADLPHTIFGKQCRDMESSLSNIGVPYTVLRLPLFVDNLLAHQTSVRKNSTIFWSIRPDAPFTPVVVNDASVAAAAVIASPEKHKGKTYTIVSDRVTYSGIADAFSQQLRRHVGFVPITYESAKALLQKHGFSEIKAKAMIELYRLVDDGSSATNQSDLNDFSNITGQEPTRVQTWIKKNAFLFK